MDGVVIRQFTARVDVVHRLISTAWSQTDLLGDLMPHSPGKRALVERSIGEAADILADDGVVVSERDQRDAALLLEMQVNAYLDAQEEIRAMHLADEIEAGDRRPDGEVAPYTKYWGV